MCWDYGPPQTEEEMARDRQLIGSLAVIFLIIMLVISFLFDTPKAIRENNKNQHTEEVN